MIMMVLMMCKSTKMMMWSPCDSACVKFPAFDRVDGSLPGVGARGQSEDDIKDGDNGNDNNGDGLKDK